MDANRVCIIFDEGRSVRLVDEEIDRWATLGWYRDDPDPVTVAEEVKAESDQPP